MSKTAVKPGWRTLLALAILLGVVGSSPAHAAPLWAVAEDGNLYESTDGGATWISPTALPTSDTVAMAVGLSLDVVFAALATASGSVYVGWPGSWSPYGSVASSDVTALAVRGNGSIILLSSSGTTWVDFSISHVLDGSDWTSLTLRRDQTARLSAISRSGRLAQSIDGGRTWSEIADTGISNVVEIVALHHDLYVLTQAGGVWRRLAASTSWDSIGTVGGGDWVSLVAEDGRLFACNRSGAVATSMNGADWSGAGAVGSSVVCLGSADTPTTIPGDQRFGWLRVGRPWPNPAPPGPDTVTFPIWAAADGVVSVSVFDIRGRRLTTPGPLTVVPGPNLFRWVPAGLPKGTYFVRFVDAASHAHTVRLTIRAQGVSDR